MTKKPIFGNEHKDDDWGCIHTEVTSTTNKKIHLCHVNISDLKKIALELSRSVMDTSWIMDMDEGSRRSYIQTASDTADSLVKIFNTAADDNKISGEFGELMVSIGSSRSLDVIFKHTSLPISELWKPQEKGNEGFDFHTVCKKMSLILAKQNLNLLRQAHQYRMQQTKQTIFSPKTNTLETESI